MSQRLENISTQMEIILSAIYMATSHISDEQIIKQSLRSAALQVMAETIELVGDENLNRDSSGSANDNYISNNSIDNRRNSERPKSSIKVNIYKTMSFIKVLKSDGLMTDNNADLLIMTYMKLLSFINDYQPTDLYAVTDNVKDINYDIYTDMTDSNHINNKYLYLNRNTNKINLNNNYLDGASSFNKREKQIQNSNLNVKSNRRTHILDTIKAGAIEGHNMSEILTKIREINDTELKTISEKTVQRDLNSMIVDGLIMKKGEKRWSRYVLATALL